MTISPEALEHLRSEVRRLTVCGVIYKKDGSIVRCTQHDEDIVIDTGTFAGTYFATAAIGASDIKSNSDMSVDNLDISGVISDGLQFTGFTVADIEAGLFRNAPFQTFICQWDNPSLWQKIIKRGFLGEIERTAENSFTCEWRGLTQPLQQTIGRTYGERCDVTRFADSRCGLSRDEHTVGFTVTSVQSRKRFDGTFSLGSPGVIVPATGKFDLGEISFIGGANNGFLMQIKQDSAGGTVGQLDLWEALPYDVQVGDVAMVTAGCDRRWESCVLFGNTVNFRGHGRWVPGIQKIIRAPGK
jgi:uncharacterized phage protein (TIGR02218 family)